MSTEHGVDPRNVARSPETTSAAPLCESARFGPLYKAAVVILLAIYLIPVWAYPCFPSQDGPSHLYNTVVFTDLWSSNHSSFAPYYELNWRPFPNWSFTILATLFYPMFSILTVEKVILSVYLVGFIGSMFYFLRSIDIGKTVLGFGAFLFAYNWFLWMGFYNFCLSIPLALFTIGYCLRHRGVIHKHRLLILVGLMLALYLSHVVSFGITLLVLVSIFGLFGRKRRVAVAEVLLPSLPSLLLLALHVLSQPRTGERFYRPPLDWLAANALSLRIGPWFHKLEVIWFVLLWVLLLGWLIQGAVRYQQWHPEERIWWLPVGVVLVLCLALPNNFLGGSALNERFALYFGLFLLPALSLRWWRPPKWCLLAGFGLLVATQQVYLHYQLRDWNRRLEPFHNAGKQVEPYSKVLPLMFAENVVGFYVNPLLHADSYVLLQNRCVSPTNYEAYRSYFPVRYKPGAPLAAAANWFQPESFLQQNLAGYYEHVLLWNAKETVLQSPALRGFVEIRREGDVRLLKRR